MPAVVSDLVADLLAFIDRSPTPYHAVAESLRRLAAGGYRALSEAEVFRLAPGDRCTIVRNDGSLVAFEVGSEPPAAAGFRIVGAHTDSPNLRLKPRADVDCQGYRQLAVEEYGGVLLHTWLDRDLSVAGRVIVRSGDATRNLLVDFRRPLLRIPNLAIHLQRELRTDGLKLNPQTHAVPVVGLEGAPPLAQLIADQLRVDGTADIRAEDVLAFDLMTYDVQGAAVTGACGEFICASRLDNLASCHAAITSLLAAGEGGASPVTRAIVLYDHEEVGSRSAEGAGGTLLVDTLERVAAGVKGGEPQGASRARARSLLVSADMAHAVHPNHVERHEPGHRPVIGGGPVIKQNAGGSYASDAPSAGLFAALCSDAGVEPQYFVSRNDFACGSTIGPISAARAGVSAVDVGNPMLSMHSCREMAGTADVAPMIDVLRRFLAGDRRAAA
jgi:aspartyl aminopeptidase